MRRRLIVFAVLLGWLVVVAPGLLAAEELTIDEVVTRALADNPDLRASRAEIQAAVGRLRQAGLRPNPTLDLGGQKALSPDNSVSIGITLPLDLNGRKEGRVGVAERELQMKRAQLADRERRLRADVRMKAGEYLAVRRNLEVTDDLLKVNREAAELVGRRVQEGATPALDLNLMLVEVNRLDAARQMLASRLEVVALQLKALAGLTPEVPLSLRGELAAPAAIPERGGAVERALAVRSDVEAARLDVALGRARVRKEEAEGRWDASVNIGYQRQETGFMLNGLTDSGAIRPIQDTFHYFGGGVSIMLPVRNRNQGNIAAARAEAEAAERRQDFAVLTVRQEIDAAFVQHEAARRSLAIYARGVRELAQRNLDVVRQSYQLGRATLLEVIAEQRRYIDVENGYTDVLRQVYEAAVEVRRAVGGE